MRLKLFKMTSSEDYIAEYYSAGGMLSTSENSSTANEY